MLRFFFYLFLVTNAALIALNMGVLSNLSTSKQSVQRTQPELHAEQLQLLSADAAHAIVEADAAKKAAEKKAEETNKLIACLEVSPFQQSELAAFETKLKALALGDRQVRNNLVDVASHIVFIPSLGSKDGADKKATELKRLGITDFFIVQDQSNLKWGISLGVFRTEESAKAHLADLNAKGVKSAKIGLRTVTVNKFLFQLRNLSVDEKKRFDLIMADYHEQEVKACPPVANPVATTAASIGARASASAPASANAKPR